ncbi:DUF1376 domain-containing protein [Ruegeria sp. 2205SS24-7]|uniref:DUF1376 domain-containing protein n=1 Tax=Ruegeria discodermiae TaxID=3064389 RepID=UPI0027428393|nr:DUF1376 domain-containing protein [Ruegeria sp. 2205SS24-7]MDP5216712.1 DUF1376 domain-containing protein [Ruegeria sp. 2205SS24-7]
MSDFNPQRARAKRPCPLWVDAFQRDTQHLGADEVGAYMMILMAMWTRESCDFPDEDRRLAAVCRVSQRLWKSRIGPVIREFLIAEDGVLKSKKLREQATYVERQCKAQSDRKTAEKPDKALKDNEPPPSTDATAEDAVDKSPDHPSQVTKLPISSDTNVSDAEASPVDFTKEVFDRGVAFLSKYGTPEKKARSLIGMWRKDAGDSETFNALRDANREGVTEPVSWITARLKQKPEQPSTADLVAQAMEANRERI